MLAKIFEILSFVTLIATAALYILYKDETGIVNFWMMLMILSAVIFRMISIQFKYNALKKENSSLKKDLKNLTSILEKKSEIK